MSEETPHRRRPRYSGKYPRRFEEKYKELDPAKHAETIAKVLASGKTPAGSHVPIMVQEILDALDPKPGERAVDCTLGHGGHSRAILQRLAPGGCLIGLDADPIELPKTEAILRGEGFGEDVFIARKSNFARRSVEAVPQLRQRSQPPFLWGCEKSSNPGHLEMHKSLTSVAQCCLP